MVPKLIGLIDAALDAKRELEDRLLKNRIKILHFKGNNQELLGIKRSHLKDLKVYMKLYIGIANIDPEVIEDEIYCIEDWIEEMCGKEE